MLFFFTNGLDVVVCEAFYVVTSISSRVNCNMRLHAALGVLVAAVVAQTPLVDLIRRKESAVFAIASRADVLWASRCRNASLVARTCELGCTQDACSARVTHPSCSPEYEFGRPAVCASAPAGRVIDFNASNVFVSAETDEAASDVCNFATLDSTFISNAMIDPYAGFQRFSTLSGAVRRFPATSALNSSGACSISDPRVAEPFVSAASGPKNVILVIDISGSMETDVSPGRSRLDAAKEAAVAVLSGLGPSSYVSVVTFSSGASALIRPFLMRATVSTKASLIRMVMELRFGGGTNYEAAFNTAFSVLRNSPEMACGVTENSRNSTLQADFGRTAIIFLTDGEPTEPTNNFLFLRDTDWDILPDKPRIFSYAFGSGVKIDKLRDVSCSTGGVAQRVGADEDLAGAMARYYELYAIGAQAQSVVTWSNPTVDPDGLGNVTTASLAVLDRTVSPIALVGVASLDVLVSELTTGTGCNADTALGELFARSSVCEKFSLSELDLQRYRARVDPCGVCSTPAPDIPGFQFPATCALASVSQTRSPTKSPSASLGVTRSASHTGTTSATASPSFQPQCAALLSRPLAAACPVVAPVPLASVVESSCCSGLAPGPIALPVCPNGTESRYGRCIALRTIPDEQIAALLCVTASPTGTATHTATSSGTMTPTASATPSLSPYVECDATTANGTGAHGNATNGTETGALCFVPIVVARPGVVVPVGLESHVVPLAVAVPLATLLLIGLLAAWIYLRRKPSAVTLTAKASGEALGEGHGIAGAAQLGEASMVSNAFYKREEIARVNRLPLPQSSVPSARAPSLSERQGSVRLAAGWWHLIGGQQPGEVTPRGPTPPGSGRSVDALPIEHAPVTASISTRNLLMQAAPHAQLQASRPVSTRNLLAQPSASRPVSSRNLLSPSPSTNVDRASVRFDSPIAPHDLEAGPASIAPARSLMASVRKSVRLLSAPEAACPAPLTPAPKAPGSTWRDRARAAVAAHNGKRFDSNGFGDFVYAYVGSTRMVVRNPASPVVQAAAAAESAALATTESPLADYPSRGRDDSPSIRSFGSSSHGRGTGLASPGGLGRAVTSVGASSRGLVEPARPLRMAPLRAVSVPSVAGSGI